MAYNREEAKQSKPLFWVGDSQKAIRNLPDEVKEVFGFALYQAQLGERHLNAKTLSGFGGAGVIEVVENFAGDTYRAVYTVKFTEVVYVLHCYKKKSKQGIAATRQDIELVKQRLNAAEEHYKQWQNQTKSRKPG